jgi:paraquat-inducible protein A
MIACPDCDLLQRPVSAPEGGMTLCVRCRAVLKRHGPGDFDRTLACALAAAVMLLLANAFPLVTLNIQAQQISTTLFDTVRTLWSQDMESLALLVAFTTIVAPALEVLTVAYLLLHIRFGTRPRFPALALRIAHGVDEWSMTEVFMLGALVALVKLGDYARVEFGIALWSLGALMILLAVIAANFDTHAAWERIEAA